jgi:hypothetical protein
MFTYIVGCVPRPEKRENSRKKFENLSILTNFSQFWLYFMNLNHVLKKVGRGISHDLFSNWYFRNLQVSSFVYSILEVSFYLELIIIIIIKSIKCNFYFGNVLRCSAVSFAFRTSTLVLELHSLALWCLNPWLGIFLMVGGCRFPLSEDLVVLLTSRSHWKKSLGYPKLVSICWFTDFWVNKSLSMMCPPHYRFVFSPLAKKNPPHISPRTIQCLAHQL